MDIFKKLNYILDKKQKINIVVLAVMIFIGGIMETLSISAMLPVVWVIIDAESVQQNKYCQWIMELLHIQNMQGFIIMLLVALMIMYILNNAYLLLLTSEQNRFISVNRNRLISQVLREFSNRPYEFYLDADIPTVFRLTDSDIPNVFGILMAIISLASEVVVFVLICGVLIVTDWKLVLVLIFISGIVTLVLFKVLKPKLNSLGMTNQAIQSRIAKWRIQAIYGIKDVKVLHRESFFADNYESNGKIGAKLNQKYAIINALPRILIETIFMVSILGYLVVCVALGDDMTQMLPTLTAFGLAAVRLLPCVNRINTYLTDISYFRPCLDYVYENMNINEISKKTNQTLLPVDETKTMKLRNRIELKDIVYAYPNTDTLIFNHADMEIPYGKSIGIMGPSGAGKSTIVDILLGLLKVHEGQILCDGDMYLIIILHGWHRLDIFLSLFIW